MAMSILSHGADATVDVLTAIANISGFIAAAALPVFSAVLLV